MMCWGRRKDGRMNKPCENCEKADGREDYLKCDNPCQTAKKCYENDRKLLNVLAGFMPEISGQDGG